MYPRVTLKFRKVLDCFGIIFGVLLLIIFYVGVPKPENKERLLKDDRIFRSKIIHSDSDYASMADVGIFLKVNIKVFKSNGTVEILFNNTGIKTILFRDDWFIALSITNGKYNHFDNFHCGKRNHILDGFYLTICPDVPIKPGQSVGLTMQKHSVIRSNFFPNWYVVDSKSNFVLLESTKDEDCNFVHFMDDKDKSEEIRGFYRLSMNDDQSLHTEDISLKIIPKPLKIKKLSEDIVRLNQDDFRIVISNGLNLEAFYLSGNELKLSTFIYELHNIRCIIID